MSYSTGKNFNSQHWYDTYIDRRTREAIRCKSEEFEREHAEDSDAELLDLIRAKADELGYVPYAAECLAASLIIRRFGSWNKAVRMAKLPHPKGPYHLRDTRLYQEEYKLQQKLRRIEKEQKKNKRKAAERERQKRKEERERQSE